MVYSEDVGTYLSLDSISPDSGSVVMQYTNTCYLVYRIFSFFRITIERTMGDATLSLCDFSQLDCDHSLIAAGFGAGNQ